MDRAKYIVMADAIRDAVRAGQLLELVAGCSSWWLGLDDAEGDQANREAAAILERLSDEVDQWESN